MRSLEDWSGQATQARLPLNFLLPEAFFFFFLFFLKKKKRLGGDPAGMQILTSLAGIVGPQLYTTPPYRQGLRSNVVALVFGLSTNIVLLIYMIYENRKRQRYLAENPHLKTSDFAFRDLTDKQNPFCINIL